MKTEEEQTKERSAGVPCKTNVKAGDALAHPSAQAYRLNLEAVIAKVGKPDPVPS